jgi:hypothetical protein
MQGAAQAVAPKLAAAQHIPAGKRARPHWRARAGGSRAVRNAQVVA